MTNRNVTEQRARLAVQAERMRGEYDARVRPLLRDFIALNAAEVSADGHRFALEEERFVTYCTYNRDEPIEWRLLRVWLTDLATQLGPDVVRRATLNDLGPIVNAADQRIKQRIADQLWVLDPVGFGLFTTASLNAAAPATPAAGAEADAGSAEEARRDAEQYAADAADRLETAKTVAEALNANTYAQLAVAARLAQVAAVLTRVRP